MSSKEQRLFAGLIGADWMRSIRKLGPVLGYPSVDSRTWRTKQCWSNAGLMEMKAKGSVFALLLAASTPTFAQEQIAVYSETLSGRAPITSWQTFRFFRVVKQSKDFTCGASSVATILKEFYSVPVSEEQVVAAMGKLTWTARGNLLEYGYSVTDLTRVVRQWGFRGDARFVNFAWLQLQLKRPVIVHLNYHGDEHFSVVRGVGQDGTVLLADSRWGNRRLLKAQFMAMWAGRDTPEAEGRIIEIIPLPGTAAKGDARFLSSPAPRSGLYTTMSLQRR